MTGDAVAVIVDEWPLVRVGVAQTLRARGVRVLAEVARGDEAVHLAATGGGTLLFLGLVHDTAPSELVRRAVAAGVVVVALVDHVSRDELAGMAGHGVSALLLRTVSAEELGDALNRIGRGERVIAPALLPLLVGAVTTGVDEGGLTRKEREVLARLADGMSNREIAEALYITPATVKTHLAHIYTKLGVANRQEALARAVALGVLS
ncbi:MAG TPA: response regulator transcription factor [Acidimicrobiales bacterium]|nr:response regulator transcription factor [Acidimicrobiales bacterium]